MALFKATAGELNDEAKIALVKHRLDGADDPVLGTDHDLVAYLESFFSAEMPGGDDLVAAAEFVEVADRQEVCLYSLNRRVAARSRSAEALLSLPPLGTWKLL